MEMIERVARAVREEILRQYRDDDRGKCPAGNAFYEDHVAPGLIARAAIGAMREPNGEQLAVAKLENDGVTNTNEDWDDCHRRIWQAMIDAALSTPPEPVGKD